VRPRILGERGDPNVAIPQNLLTGKDAPGASLGEKASLELLGTSGDVSRPSRKGMRGPRNLEEAERNSPEAWGRRRRGRKIGTKFN
jgi:hypothetical protein